MMAANRDDGVEAALEAHTASCVPIEPRAWKVAIANGSEVHATARVAEGWLLFESALTGAAGRDPWELLRWNAVLPGGVKFALRRGDPMPHLRAELPLGVDLDVAARIGQAFAGFSAASALLAGATHVDGDGVLADGDDAGIDLPRLCAEAGWPFVARASGALAVTLESGLEFRQATLTTEGNAVRASVPLVTNDGSRPAVRRMAVAALALRASAAVRMARAAATDMELCSEVVLAGAPAPAELGHALAALSVACRLCAGELGILAEDGAVAGLYLRCNQTPATSWKNGGFEHE